MENFRPCAGAIVFNDKGLVLLGNRIETPVDAWQFPQGGIEAGESPASAALRELFEETSITSVEPVYTEKEGVRYEFPSFVREKFQRRGINTVGQEIYFSLFYFCGEEKEINVNTTQPEFGQYAWKSFDFAVQNIIEFKKEVYVKARETFVPLIEQYLKKHS